MMTAATKLTTDITLGSIAGAWLAAHDGQALPEGLLLAVTPQREWQHLVDACERMGAWRAVRRAYYLRSCIPSPAMAQTSAPGLSRTGSDVWWRSSRLGRLVWLFRDVTPQEAQARIAYETFIARFLRYLERVAHVLAFEPTEAGVMLFIPDGIDQPAIQTLWADFVQEAFSIPALQETLVLLLNSVKLAERGFSVPEVPMVSEGQADVLIAFIYATAREIERRWMRYERLISAGVKSAEQLHQKLDKQRGNYGAALEAIGTLMGALERSDPERAVRLRTLASAYTIEATTQLKSTRAIVAKFARYMESLLTTNDYLHIPPLLTEEPPAPQFRLPGDAAVQLCYACGRALPKPKRGAKASVYTANKFIFQAPSQTLQGYFAQTEPVVCAICAALAVTCPVKPADGALIVSLRETPEEAQGADSDRAYYRYDEQLRMLTTGELNIAAGRYLLLAAKEKGPSGKLLKVQMGGYEYALFKVASLLPADVLARFDVQTHQGTTTSRLPRRHLVALSYLIEVFGLVPWALQSSKAIYGATADAVRYVEVDRLYLATYRLFNKSEGKKHFSAVDLAKLEQGRAAFARELERMNEPNGSTSTSRRFRDIAGLTGVLYAFVNLCDYSMRQKNVRDEDRIRELKKIIEDVGNPNHFTYGVADHVHGQMAQLPRVQQTRFIQEEASKLLAEVGVNVEERMATDANGRSMLRVSFDDVDALYAHLFAARYTDVRAQRDFTYELKLSLYSRFPELLMRSDERKGAAASGAPSQL